MNSVLAARLVAAGRIGFGLALIVSPGRVTARWLGGDALPLVGRVLAGAAASGGAALGAITLAGLPARSTSA